MFFPLWLFLLWFTFCVLPFVCFLLCVSFLLYPFCFSLSAFPFLIFTLSSSLPSLPFTFSFILFLSPFFIFLTFSPFHLSFSLIPFNFPFLLTFPLILSFLSSIFPLIHFPFHQTSSTCVFLICYPHTRHFKSL